MSLSRTIQTYIDFPNLQNKMDVFCKKNVLYQASGHSSNLLNSIRYCFGIKTGHWYIYGIGLWMGTTMATTSNITIMYGIYTIMSNATSISIALAVNERVIGSRHENLAIVLLLLALPSFYRKILIQPTGINMCDSIYITVSVLYFLR